MQFWTHRIVVCHKTAVLQLGVYTYTGGGRCAIVSYPLDERLAYDL